jgi:hypothetical protein
MSEANESEKNVGNQDLTTEQLANAGAPNRATGEPRAFDDGAGEERQAGEEKNQPLLSESESGELRRTWDSIQAGFVDEPRRAVEDADHLVAQTMKRLAEMFAEERQRLESQWDRGDQVSTEDLRVAFQRYRTFFGRLLSV